MIKLGTHFSSFADAKMYPSPILKRLQIAKARCRSYPMDNLDFVLNDLEHPESIRRHADMCNGDLTGRYLEFLSRSLHHDAQDEERLHLLFNRILKCKTRLGPAGRIFNEESDASVREDPFAVSSKLFIGALRYYLESGDSKALQLAVDMAEYVFINMDKVKRQMEEVKKHNKFNMSWWITEPMALLYAINGDERCLEMCRLVERYMPETIDNTHSHGFMTTLRGLQFAAIYSGDLSFNRLPEKFRKEIEERSVWADGNIPESFPMSGRNEGCSISDWIMLNLYAGFITGSGEAYEKAERAMYNAFALNQIVNGSFGHRLLNNDRKGYMQGELSEEAWWCCVHNCGVGIVEYADHAVTLRDGRVKVNLLAPGHYKIMAEGMEVTVDITTRYPEKADTIVLITGPAKPEVDIRAPSGIRNCRIDKTDVAGGTRYILRGDMGYYIEDAREGAVLKYGPLIMAPLRYISNTKTATPYDDEFLQSAAPEGYVPEVMPKDQPALIPSDKIDAAGFLIYDKEPWPYWQCYEEGILSPLAYGELSINVPLYYPDGQIRLARFYPEWLSTTTLIGFDLPVVFNKG